MEILTTAVQMLEKEQIAAGKGELYLHLRPRLDPNHADSESDADLAARL